MRTSGQTALLASPVHTGQARGRRKNTYKEETKCNPALPWVSPPSHPEDVFSSACQIKRSCNTGPPFQILAAARQNQGNYTLPRLWVGHLAGFIPQFNLSLAVSNWASYLTSLYLSFILCKTGLIAVCSKATQSRCIIHTKSIELYHVNRKESKVC